MMNIVELQLPDPECAWAELGFEVHDGLIVLDRCSIRLGAEGLGFGVDGTVERNDWLGLPLAAATSPSPAGAVSHPNGVVGVDHIVVMAPDPVTVRTEAAAAGVQIRRQRPALLFGVDVVQLFVWAGTTLLEIVCPSEPNDLVMTTSIWGVSLVADDLDATVAHLGSHIGGPRDAVQPGRRIATVKRRQTGLGIEVAVMSPHPQNDTPI